MTPIRAPEDIISHLLAADGKPPAFKPWSNRLQKWLFLTAISGFAGGATCAILYQYAPGTYLRWGTLGALALSQITASLYQLATVVPAIRMFGDPAKTIAAPAQQHFNADIQTITDLARMHEQHELDYARDRLAQVIEQLRYRLGFMIGAVEKVGVFPAAIAGYLHAKEILTTPAFASSGIEWVFAALVAFYIMATVFMTASQRLERLALVARHAAAKKQRDMPAKDGEADA